MSRETNEPRKKPSYFALHWLVNRDPYSGLLYSRYNWVEKIPFMQQIARVLVTADLRLQAMTSFQEGRISIGRIISVTNYHTKRETFFHIGTTKWPKKKGVTFGKRPIILGTVSSR